MAGYDPAENDPLESIGEDTISDLPRNHKAPDPAKDLSVFFDRSWHRMARSHREWRMFMPSHPGRSRNWFKAQLDREIPVDILESYVEAFMDDVAAGLIPLARGQSPFQAFTGWVQSADVEDRADREQRKTKHDTTIRAYEQWRREQGLR